MALKTTDRKPRLGTSAAARATRMEPVVKLPPEKIPRGHKQCTKCGKVHPLEEFPKRAPRQQGLSPLDPRRRGSHCKKCVRTYMNNYMRDRRRVKRQQANAARQAATQTD